jgi:hypothetical protein
MRDSQGRTRKLRNGFGTGSAASGRGAQPAGFAAHQAFRAHEINGRQSVVIFKAGQKVRVRMDGSVGRVFLKLPLAEMYLVQMPGFPVVEKVYYGSDLEPLADVRVKVRARQKR